MTSSELSPLHLSADRAFSLYGVRSGLADCSLERAARKVGNCQARGHFPTCNQLAKAIISCLVLECAGD